LITGSIGAMSHKTNEVVIDSPPLSELSGKHRSGVVYCGSGRPVTYVAFIRNVMIGRKGLTRDVLLGAFTRCGATMAVSVLTTGNIVFTLTHPDIADFVNAVASVLREETGMEEPLFVRSLTELLEMQASDPFAAAPMDDIYERTVTLLPGPLPALPPTPITSARGDVEIFAIWPGEAYAVTHLIDGRTGNPGALIEKLVPVKVTTRNWRTIERILKRYG
jgi:uncharacterized protein (DUF1697 family)